jgi:hypothetical protein
MGVGQHQLLFGQRSGRYRRSTTARREAAKSSARMYFASHSVSEPQTLEADVRAKRAKAAGMSPAARTLRSDVVRRAASRGGTLRCAEARRVAYRNVDKSYASHRLG